MNYLEDINIGEDIVFPGRYTVTQESIMETGREWDPYPFHTDPVAAADTIYGALVASTVQLFAISVNLGHSATMPLAAVSSLGLNDLKNHAPAYAGDTLELHCTFLEKKYLRKKKTLLSSVKVHYQQIVYLPALMKSLILI